MNTGTRRSTFLTKREARKLFDAVCIAFCIGKYLNRFVTVHLEKAGAKANAHEVLTAFLHHAGDWLRTKTGDPLFYIWVLENPVVPDEDGRGLHVHLLIHVPDRLWGPFQRKCRNWLNAAGGKCKRGVVAHRTLHGWGEFGPNVKYLHTGLLDRLHYILKGLRPTDAERFNLKYRAPQGEVRGKRTGRSESLNPKRCAWPVRRYSQWPGIWVVGPELRRLRFLRGQLADVLPGVEEVPCRALSDTVDLDVLDLRSGTAWVGRTGLGTFLSTGRENAGDGHIGAGRRPDGSTGKTGL